MPSLCVTERSLEPSEQALAVRRIGDNSRDGRREEGALESSTICLIMPDKGDLVTLGGDAGSMASSKGISARLRFASDSSSVLLRRSDPKGRGGTQASLLCWAVADLSAATADSAEARVVEGISGALAVEVVPAALTKVVPSAVEVVSTPFFLRMHSIAVSLAGRTRLPPGDTVPLVPSTLVGEITSVNSSRCS